ncbi:MAG: hypothetical protein JNK67_16745 [Alphaproteobacteria bacterium]|nr:hypothetical protein [Alphaproteobacteria bacterium]
MATATAASRAGAEDWSGLELTHRNHFKFGYDGRWFVPRPSASARWQVAYGRARHEPASWREACIDTARLVRAATDLDLWVLYSGGIDSEVVLQAFMFAGIPVRVAITRFAGDLNRHDIAYAIKFCETHEVPYRLLDLDIERFFESGEALAYAHRTRCVQPQLLHTMWAMDRIDGYPILGSGECYLERRDARPGEAPETPRGGVWELLEKERIAAWYRHLLSRGRPGCAGFFQFDPQNMLAFLRDPAVVAMCADRLAGLADSRAIKGAVYRRHFLLEPRPKYHGFENVLALDDALRPELERRFGASDAVARTAYGALMRELVP